MNNVTVVANASCTCDIPQLNRPDCKWHTYLLTDEGWVTNEWSGTFDEVTVIPKLSIVWEGEPAPFDDIVDEFSLVTVDDYANYDYI